MARLTISLPENLCTAAAEHAATQKRSASGYVAMLIEQDLRAAGLLPPIFVPDRKEVLAKVAAALDSKTVTESDIEKFLRTRIRKSRAAA